MIAYLPETFQCANFLHLNISINISYCSSYISNSPDKENLMNTKEFLYLVIIFLNIMTFMANSAGNLKKEWNVRAKRSELGNRTHPAWLRNDYRIITNYTAQRLWGSSVDWGKGIQKWSSTKEALDCWTIFPRLHRSVSGKHAHWH